MENELNKVVAGTPLTPEQKAALAKENAEGSVEAHRLAAEQHALDIREGRGEPAVTKVASLLKDKLIREDFQTKTPPPASNAE